AAWTAFLASTTASGGCGGVLANNATTPPSACGGFRDVTWTYTVSNACGSYPSGCDSNGRVTCTKRFTVATAPLVTFKCGNNVTVPACSTQSQVNAAWTSFLCSTTVSGGINGVLTNNAPSNPPSACGGSVNVTWTYTGSCGQTQSCTKTFTVTSGGRVDVTGPSNVSYNGCNFTSQYALNCAFNNWLAQFQTVSSGCSSSSNCGTSSGGATAVFSGDPRVAPSLFNGGCVRVTYSIAGSCNQDVVSATFTVSRRVNCNNCTSKGPETSIPSDNLVKGMSVKVYPNPYTESFKLDLTTSSEDKVGVAIYDMTGKLIEQREVNSSDIQSIQIGDRYPTGVYNVIVTQGTEVKTLRVVKR
ncbi:T9SS type A sorting domain-containing protein, partial [Flavobacterium sp. RSB2_4_14]|uniref:T9SS type A sorting domain-containing protein n=1 Tax=Flavobacterium sp. RSB2_4_14 TaxID=3447665 RepID=UPI003F372EA4